MDAVADVAAPACPVCAAAGSGPRCAACGAGFAPGGLHVERLIAQTIHGRLYRARDAKGRTVALKELVFALAPDAATVDAFEREARLLSEIDHPSIPRFLGSFREGDGAELRLYLAQEFVEGDTLLERIGERRLDESEARDLAERVLGILGYLHDRRPRLLHRDIKPANLILGRDGRISLVDFGAARATEAGATHGATVVGTFGYAPIEQLGGTADERSDLYALGATLIHCVTGIPPAELLTASFTIDFARHAAISRDFERFLARLTARREQRPPSAARALDLLHGTETTPRSNAFERVLERRGMPGLPGAATVRRGLFLGIVSLVAAAGIDEFVTGRWTHRGIPGPIVGLLRRDVRPPPSYPSPGPVVHVAPVPLDFRMSDTYAPPTKLPPNTRLPKLQGSRVYPRPR